MANRSRGPPTRGKSIARTADPCAAVVRAPGEAPETANAVIVPPSTGRSLGRAQDDHRAASSAHPRRSITLPGLSPRRPLCRRGVLPCPLPGQFADQVDGGRPRCPAAARSRSARRTRRAAGPGRAARCTIPVSRWVRRASIGSRAASTTAMWSASRARRLATVEHGAHGVAGQDQRSQPVPPGSAGEVQPHRRPVRALPRPSCRPRRPTGRPRPAGSAGSPPRPNRSADRRRHVGGRHPFGPTQGRRTVNDAVGDVGEHAARPSRSARVSPSDTPLSARTVAQPLGRGPEFWPEQAGLAQRVDRRVVPVGDEGPARRAGLLEPAITQFGAGQGGDARG